MRLYRYHILGIYVVAATAFGGILWASAGRSPGPGMALWGGIMFLTAAGVLACEGGKDWAERELGEGEDQL